MAWEYSNKTKQLFLDAMAQKPGTHLGEMHNPDAVGEDGSIVCGDAMKIFLKINHHPTDPLKDQIIEIKYQTFGCTSAIASSEALCQMIEKDKLTPLDALKITNQDIVNFLDGLPDQKIHCSVMGAEALEAAVHDWAGRRGVDIAKHLHHCKNEHQEEGRIVCSCFNLTEPYLLRKIREMNLKTVEELTNATKAGGACGACINRPGGLQDLIKQVWGDNIANEEAGQKAQEKYCNFQDQIKKAIEEKVRPALKLHGGDITLIGVKDNKVYCSLEGACSGCSGAKFTIKNTVEKQLKELVDQSIIVIDV